jgi:hypothetical protein
MSAGVRQLAGIFFALLFSKRESEKIVSFDPWVVKGEVLGAVAVYIYDDVTTERPADYWEEGDLLTVSWFDRFGIRRRAVDRGIVEEEDKLGELSLLF